MTLQHLNGEIAATDLLLHRPLPRPAADRQRALPWSGLQGPQACPLLLVPRLGLQCLRLVPCQQPPYGTSSSWPSHQSYCQQGARPPSPQPLPAGSMEGCERFCGALVSRDQHMMQTAATGMGCNVRQTACQASQEGEVLHFSFLCRQLQVAQIIANRKQKQKQKQQQQQKQKQKQLSLMKRSWLDSAGSVLTSLYLAGNLMRSRSLLGDGALTGAGAGACTCGPVCCTLSWGGWGGSSSGAGMRLGFLLLKPSRLCPVSALLLADVGTTLMLQGCIFSRAAIPAAHMSVLNKGKVELSKRQWGGGAWKDSHRNAIAMSLRWQSEMTEHSWGQTLYA